jgi:hypothetical protein
MDQVRRADAGRRRIVQQLDRLHRVIEIPGEVADVTPRPGEDAMAAGKEIPVPTGHGVLVHLPQGPGRLGQFAGALDQLGPQQPRPPDELGVPRSTAHCSYPSTSARPACP